MFCPKCGAENPDDGVFCKACGFQLKSEEQPVAAPAEPGVPAAEAPAPAAPMTYAMGNTSGQGADAPTPPEASGWTFAGFIPFGIYAFKHGISMWAYIGLAGSIGCCIPFLNFIAIFAVLAYAIFIGINGKKLAWQFRQFDSVQQYVDTQKPWHMWGIILLVVGIVMIVLGGCMTCVMFASGLGGSY